MPLRLALLVALASLALVPTASAQSAPCENGTAAGYACSKVDLLAFYTPQELGTPPAGQCPSPYPGLCANDIWGWTDPETDRRYAIVGLATGTAFVDVTTPTAPIRLGMLPTQTVGSSWRDVKAIGNVAIVVSEAPGHGMQIFDLTRLRGLTENPARRFNADAVYTGIGSAHNVVVNEATDFAYLVGGRSASGLPSACSARGVHAVNLSNPMHPTFGGCFSDVALEASPVTSPGYTHDAQCVLYSGPDADYVGHELCFAANEDVVRIFDVTDKQNVVIVSKAEYPLDAYTHQGWLTEDQRYLLVNDELDEYNKIVSTQRTIVFDVSDLDNPELDFVYDSGQTTIDHNLYVLGHLAYESNYEAGLRVLDLSGIGSGSLREVAYFDTYTPSTTAEFAGQWSNYPFFGNGLVIANDGETGFFVLQVHPDVVVGTSETPAETGYALSEAHPNPTARGARLTLSVTQAQAVRAELFDVAGRRLATLFDGAASPGADLALDVGRDDLPAGVYVVRVTGEAFEASRRVVFTR